MPNYKVTKKLVRIALKANLSVLLRGHPGVGKSTMARELAKEFNLPLVELRLSQIEPSEITGVKVPDRESKKLVHYPPDWAPIDKPAFIFLDEINAGVSKLHQAAAYQIVLDKAIGNFKFHPETRVMAAGNLEEDNAIVTTLSQALNNRFVHFILEPDVDTWLEWARDRGISPEIRAYISFGGIKALYNNTGESAFPTPRSIEMADALYKEAKAQKLKGSELRELIASAIGEASANELLTFIDLYSSINIEEIITQGKLPDKDEPSFLYALTYSAAHFVREKLDKKKIDAYHKNIINFLKFLSQKHSDELIVLFIREVNTKESTSKALLNHLISDDHFIKIIREIIETSDIFENA